MKTWINSTVNMQVPFSKYQGTGNDFILIDHRSSKSGFSKDEIQKLCDRKFGIGSDGLILIEPGINTDFKMTFFNPDGSQSFCGNGSRCALDFAKKIGIFKDKTRFEAFDGLHEGSINGDVVTVKMADVKLPRKVESGFFLNTGSPHFVMENNDINKLDINNIALKYRFRYDLFGDEGTNVNFMSEVKTGLIFVRTYERGVEAETLSCGTGVVAAAIVYGIKKNLEEVQVETLGGKLVIKFICNEDILEEVYLSGPAKEVFRGSVDL